MFFLEVMCLLIFPLVLVLVSLCKAIWELICRIFGMDPNPRETERVKLLNDQIEHDRKILDHLYSHQANWDEVAEARYQQLKAEEARMRKRMEALDVS